MKIGEFVIPKNSDVPTFGRLVRVECVPTVDLAEQFHQVAGSSPKKWRVHMIPAEKGRILVKYVNDLLQEFSYGNSRHELPSRRIESGEEGIKFLNVSIELMIIPIVWNLQSV